MFKKAFIYCWFGLLYLPAIWGKEQSPAPSSSAATPAPSGKGADSDKPTEGEKDIEAFREAAKAFGVTHEVKNLVSAMDVLRKGFPASRPVLLECLAKGSPGAKCFALQVLGEQGEAGKDLEVVSKALHDASSQVRLAAAMAIRRLGKDGYPALKEYLLREPEPNNRKMAIKTLQQWGDPAAIPLLVQLLRKEKERPVRNFLVTALEVLSGKNLGDNTDAWETYASDMAAQKQAKALLSVKNPEAETKP